MKHACEAGSAFDQIRFISEVQFDMNERKFIKSLYCGVSSEILGPSDSSILKLKDTAVGETCFVLGNGPSLADVDNKTLERYPTFGTNGIFLKHTPNYYVTISVDFYKNHFDAIKGLKGSVKFIGDNLHDLHTGSVDEHILNCNWNVYGNVRGPKQPVFNFPVPVRFSKRADRVVYLGGTVLSICLQLAYWMGYTRVILLGVDHKFGFPRSEAVYGGRRLDAEDGDSIHFDKAYSKPGYTPHCDMIAVERSFELALKAFQKAGREIVNATPNTGLDVIPKRELKDLL